MNHALVVASSSDSQPSNALVGVNRAIAELRRGGYILIQATDGSKAIVLASEAATDATLARLAELAGNSPRLALTERRTIALGLTAENSGISLVMTPGGLTATQVANLSDPLDIGFPDSRLSILDGPHPDWAEGAVTLAKLARLLPAAVVASCSCEQPDLFHVAASDVLAYRRTAADTLRCVGEATAPLPDAGDSHVFVFRPADGGGEHLAIVIGHPDRSQPVLTRIHSECFTGDLLGSLRCDCGDQLRGAIAKLAETNGGVLLYLAQEGRGIGLINKLRAYELQDAGFDTVDANRQLGFSDDERIYLPAAEMLRQLGIHKVRLLTNNPKKVNGLTRHGVLVVERVPHIFSSNVHNEFYLMTKSIRSGHLL